PSQLEGRTLIPLALSAREESFLAGFPGAVRRYTDGDREVIVRWVTHASRRLHPAADCYRAMGFEVGDATVERSPGGVERRCFVAHRAGSKQRVCEEIADATGAHWTDVSAWYWASTLGHSTGPWWFVTTATTLER